MGKDRFIANDDMFGANVKIPTGASMAMHIYKVVGRIESNRYCDVPIMAGTKAALHSEIVPVLNVVHCGVSEDTIIRVSLSDCEIVQQPNAPLTLEELREMDGEPVYSPRLQEWGLVAAGGFAFTNMVYICDKAGNLRPATVWLACGPVCRRKPEEETK